MQTQKLPSRADRVSADAPPGRTTSRRAGGTQSSAQSIAKKGRAAAYVVRSSSIHGTGVFARRRIPAGTCIVEYQGERISWDEAQQRAQAAGSPVSHTYFFSLADGRIIDGGAGGNEARFINHACEPNCEPYEDEQGRVYIYSMADIERGEELTYYYALIYEGRHTAAIKRAFPCYCGSPNCAGTMLAPKKTKRTG